MHHPPARWSAKTTKETNALELDEGVFTWDDPTQIARSLKRSAVESRKRKGSPFQAAMSMLDFYVNRAGSNLPEDQKKILEQAKVELRRVFGIE